MVEAAVPRRPNAMSLQHILCSSAVNIALVQESVQPRERTASSALLPYHDTARISPSVVEDMSIYLNDLDEKEVEVVQPSHVHSHVLGWTPPDGSEDVEINPEDVTCPFRVSISALCRISELGDYHIPQLAYVKSMLPPAQPPRTRVVLAPTQGTASKTKRRVQTRGYGQPPKGGIPPALARDVTKTHTLRAEKERDRMRAAVARSNEGRTPSVQQKDC